MKFCPKLHSRSHRSSQCISSEFHMDATCIWNSAAMVLDHDLSDHSLPFLEWRGFFPTCRTRSELYLLCERAPLTPLVPNGDSSDSWLTQNCHFNSQANCSGFPQQSKLMNPAIIFVNLNQGTLINPKPLRTAGLDRPCMQQLLHRGSPKELWSHFGWR